MQKSKRNKIAFAVIGLGFIADRHIASIKDIGGEVLIGCDVDKTKKHKIGKATFYENWKDIPKDDNFKKIDYVVICTPNYLHSEMSVAFAILGKQILLEKPAAIDMENLRLFKYFNSNINHVVQLRYNPKLIELKKMIDIKKKYEASFAVCVHRDDWYYNCWKNNDEQSGGLLFNIGIHYFDVLCWLFGHPISSEITRSTKGLSKGRVYFKNCDVKWKLSINQPMDNQFRYLKVNGEKINLTDNFEGSHTRVYKEMLAGNAIKITDIEEGLKLVNKLYGR